VGQLAREASVGSRSASNRAVPFCTACGLFATGYGALDLMPAPGMAFLLGWGPAIAVAWWPSEDCKRTRTVEAFDSGLRLSPTGWRW
jgi:hypothetical protein